MKKSFLAGCGVTVMVGTLAIGTAFATPGVNPPTAEQLASGTLDGPSKAKQDKIQLKVSQDTTVRAFTLTYKPGSTSGWHRHPGIVVAIVESGEVTRRLENDCEEVTFKKDDVFTEVEGHFIRNPSPDTDAVLRITQFFPADIDPKLSREDIPVDPCRKKRRG